MGNLVFTGISATVAECVATYQVEQCDQYHIDAKFSEDTTKKIIAFCNEVIISLLFFLMSR